jgi:hypothetical protein
MEERERLWMSHSVGESLSEEEQTALLGAIATDPVWREEVLRDIRTIGMVTAVGRNLDSPDASEHFVREWTARLTAEGDGQRFVDRVIRRMPAKSHRRQPPPRWRYAAFGLGLVGVAFASWMLTRSPKNAPAKVVALMETLPVLDLDVRRSKVEPAERFTQMDVDGEEDVVSPLPSNASVIYSWNFEDGLTPAQMLHGQIDDGPPRPGNKHVALGTLSFSPWAGKKYTVGMFDPEQKSLFAFGSTQALMFDYWVGKDTSKIVLQFRNRTQPQSYNHILNSPAIETWVHVALPLLEFNPVVDPALRNTEGDAIDSLLFMGGQLGGAPIYIDNIVVFSVPGGP